LIEINKLYNIDCLKGMDKMIEQGIKVDVVITDIPYGTTKCKWDSIIPFDEMWSRLKIIRKNKNTPIVLFGSEPFSSALRMSNIKEYKYDFKWDKVTGSGHLNSKNQPLQRIEDIMVFGIGKIIYNPQMIELSQEEYNKKIAKISRKDTYLSNTELTNSRNELSIKDRDIKGYKFAYPNNILVYSKYLKECNNINRIHSTQKPIDLIEYLVKTYSNEGDLILDFTCGSGTTAVASINLKRNYIGFDNGKNEKTGEYWVDVANRRIFELFNDKK